MYKARRHEGCFRPFLACTGKEAHSEAMGSYAQLSKEASPGMGLEGARCLASSTIALGFSFTNSASQGHNGVLFVRPCLHPEAGRSRVAAEGWGGMCDAAHLSKEASPGLGLDGARCLASSMRALSFMLRNSSAHLLMHREAGQQQA